MLDFKLCEVPEINIWTYYGTVKLNTYCFTRLPDVDIDYSFSGPVTSNESI